MFAITICNKCGTRVKLDLGEMTRYQAEQAFERLDRNGGHCPGHHVELGGFRRMWSLDDVLHRVYDLGEFEAEAGIPDDRAYVEELLSQGKVIFDGGAKTVPELELPSIQSVTGLTHLGGGEFSNHTYIFYRCDSPFGTRFYERLPK